MFPSITAAGERGIRRRCVPNVNRARGEVDSPGFGRVDNGVIDERVEVALFRGDRIVAVKDQITDDGEL